MNRNVNDKYLNNGMFYMRELPEAVDPSNHYKPLKIMFTCPNKIFFYK